MNKNPFVPIPSFPHPPLPPGPPPAQPAQQDFSAYWAAAAAQQQQQQSHANMVPQPGAPAYNPQWPNAGQQGWTAPQPVQAPSTPAKPGEHSALYANYGYGGQHSLHWQQQQQQQQQQHQQQHGQHHQHHYAQPPVPPAPLQPQYSPYQPQQAAATPMYQQPFVAQAPSVHPQPPMQQPFRPAQQPPTQPYFPQQPHHQLQHTPPHQLPPAKRQRFDNSHPPPPQPRFQPPPPPPQPAGSQHGFGRSHSMSGPPPGGGTGGGGMSGQVPMSSSASFSGSRGGMGGGRGGGGGGMANRSGRGGPMSGNRGMGMNRNRGGSTFGGGRGGGTSGSQMRGHGSRDRGGFGNSGNRRGGSFGAAHHMNSGGGSSGGSFRGHSRPGGGSSGYTSHSRGGGRMSDGHQNRPVNGSTTSGIGNFSSKKDENRRTLTDFKLVGLEIQNLDWRWGAVPLSNGHEEVKLEPDLTVSEDKSKPSNTGQNADGKDNIKSEEVEMTLIVTKAESDQLHTEASTSDTSTVVESSTLSGSTAPVAISNSNPNTGSRLRIYFHTPHSLDDTRMIPINTSPDTRKNKRKKGEDDDGDGDDDGSRRAPPPPNPSGLGAHDTEERLSVAPSLDIEGTGRSSIAPSVAETNSEGDWLMAAIAGGEADADAHEDIDLDADADAEGDLDDDAEGEYDLEATQIIDEDDLSQSQLGPSPEDVHRTDNKFSDGRLDVDEHMSDSELLVTLEDHNDHHDDKDANPKDLASAELTDTSATIATSVNGTTKNDVTESRNGENVHDSKSPAIVLPTNSSLPHESSTALEKENLTTSTQGGDITVPSSTAANAPILEAAKSDAHVQRDQSNVDSSENKVPETDGANGVPLENKSTTEQEHDQEHLPEPPASPLSVVATLPSSSSTASLNAPAEPLTSPKITAAIAQATEGRVPSANRLSISYALGARRLVIDAEIVENLRVFRSDGRIEVSMIVERIPDGFKGILIEALDEDSKSYAPLKDLSEAYESDVTLPPFWCFVLPTKTTLVVYLDTERPLSEPKWVKTGDVQDWLKSMFGRMFWVTGDAIGWEKKIEVVDPDPAPTIGNVLDGWSSNSPVGSLTERQRFLKTHMTESDNMLEILLRLVRGERATPFSQGASVISSSSVSGPLLSALNLSSPHASQQTHVSLAVLAFVRLATEFAEKALGQDKGKTKVEERVGEIIRSLPSHLLYKSLDGMFKEWRVEKKGGGR